MSKKERNLAYFYFGVVIVAILGIGLFRESIFVFGDTGRIVIDHLEPNSIIYIDKVESKKVGSEAEDNVKLKKLNIGVHQILILRQGFWPWLKEVEIRDGDRVTLSPFSVPENSSGFFINESDSEYESIISMFEALSVPNFENKKVSNSGNLTFWIADNTIFVEWIGNEEDLPKYFCNESECSLVTVPLTVGGSIRNAEFYKGREDVLIVAFGNGVFAIEINNKNHQNFQPLFEGESPQFIVSQDDKSIYILDEGILREVKL